MIERATQVVTLHAFSPRYIWRLFLETVNVQSRRIASTCASRLDRLIFPLVINRLSNLLPLATSKLSTRAWLDWSNFFLVCLLCFCHNDRRTHIRIVVSSGGTLRTYCSSGGVNIQTHVGSKRRGACRVATFLRELSSICILTFWFRLWKTESLLGCC